MPNIVNSKAPLNGFHRTQKIKTTAVK